MICISNVSKMDRVKIQDKKLLNITGAILDAWITRFQLNKAIRPNMNI